MDCRVKPGNDEQDKARRAKRDQNARIRRSAQ